MICLTLRQKAAMACLLDGLCTKEAAKARWLLTFAFALSAAT
jgi:hypothetical protein